MDGGLKRKLLLALPVLALLALFLVTGFRGVDFGVHWDEVDWQIVPVQDMVRSGLLMPRAAIYPAFAKWLVLLPALWKGLLTGLELGMEPEVIHGAMVLAITAPDVLLTARGVFIVASSLSIVWVYAAALVARMRVFEAVAGAAVLALSWEFAYHARWVATDCVVVQFAALTLLLLVCYLRFERVKYLYGAAVAAGLAIGTKFPAVPLLLPVLVCGAMKLPLRRVWAQTVRAVQLGGTAFLAYLVSTPATLFEPFKFVELLRFIASHYEKGHWGYGVKPGFEHLGKVLEYFALSYFSPYRALSVALFCVMLFGGYVWLRKDKRLGSLLVGFPLLFLGFFCFRYSALIVRNYLLVAPFLALVLAGGIGALVDAIPRAWLRPVALAGFACVALANAAWLVSAAESIRDPKVEVQMSAALEHLAKNGDGSYVLSPRLTSYAAAHGLPRGSAPKPEKNTRVAFLARAEGPNPFAWPANDPFAVERVFGPREVNFDWYPTWAGHERVVVMTYEKALGIGLPFLKRR